MKPTTQQKIKVLQLARAVVARPKYKAGLCYALSLACSNQRQLWPAAAHMKKYVTRVLGPNMFLEGWLRRNAGVQVYHSYDTPRNRRKMRATRLAWIDWMIQCYKEDLAKEGGVK